MFGMGFTEILMIAVVAILFLGPDKLPEAMVQIGKFINSFRKTINEAKSTFEEEINIRELREEALSYRQTLEEAGKDISGFKHSFPNPAEEVREAFESVKLEDSPEPWGDDDDFEELGEEYEAIIEKKREVVGSQPTPAKTAEQSAVTSDSRKIERGDEELSKKEESPRPRGFKNLSGGTPG
ncbi:Sec-independent protein translocase protein TatB [Nitratifractor sp.]